MKKSTHSIQKCTLIYKVRNIPAGRYVGRNMRPAGNVKIWTNPSLLNKALKWNQEIYGDNADFEIHTFKLELIDQALAGGGYK